MKYFKSFNIFWGFLNNSIFYDLEPFISILFRIFLKMKNITAAI